MENNTINVYIKMIPTIWIPVYFLYIRTPIFRLLKGRNCNLNVELVSKQFRYRGKYYMWIFWMKARLT